MPATPQVIGERIRDIRLSLGLSMREFARKVGVSAGTLCQWERGNCNPKPCYLCNIAEQGNITVDKLIKTTALSDYTTEELHAELERRRRNE